MQPNAVRQRRFREKRRTPAAGVSTTSAPAPAVTPPAPASSAPLRETEVVTGPGADAFAALPVLGDGDAATPLVEEAPQPKQQTTPEQAVLIAKLVGGYVGFGWSLLLKDHQDKAAAFVDVVLRAKGQLELIEKLSVEQKFVYGLSTMIGVVEESATNLAVQLNIRLPYQDYVIVGGAMATATMGIAREFKPENENAPGRTVDAQSHVTRNDNAQSDGVARPFDREPDEDEGEDDDS